MKRLLESSLELIGAVFFACCTQISEPECQKLMLDSYPFSSLDKTRGKLFSDSRIYPIDGTLLSNCIFEQADSERIIVRDKKTVITIDTNGVVLSSFSKVGRGPGEYILPVSVSFDRRRDRILIFDYYQNDRFLAYSLDGEELSAVYFKTQAATALYNNKDDCAYIISNTTEEETIILNLDSGGTRSEKGGGAEKTRGMITIPGLAQAGSDVLLIKPDCDTLYNISKPGAPPFLIIDKGNHSSDSKRRMATDEGVIMDGYVFYQDKLLFISFVYNRCRFYDIWDISHEELLYRQKISGPNEPMGYPVTINGKQLYVWPALFSEDGSMYCEISYDDVSGIEDSPDNEKNWFLRSKIVF